MKLMLICLTLACLVAVSLSSAFVGSYVRVAANDDVVQQQANWAIRQMGSGHELLAVTKAEKQLVNGMNYRMAMHVKITKMGIVRATACTVVVYVPRSGTRQLTSNNCYVRHVINGGTL